MAEFVFPGFIDVHVHFRDPGMPEAETTASGLAAACRGGIACVVTMPNTTPACDSPAGLDRQRGCAVAAASPTRLFPAACITRGRLGQEVAQLEALADAGAVFFTDDGSYVADTAVMREAMLRSVDLGRCVCQHAMDPQLLRGGVIRDCPLARRLGLPVVPVDCETSAIRRDVAICRETGCRLHIQHISTAEGVDLVRAARREGLPVTAEATPHHLLLSCEDIAVDDAAFKMAPPLGNHEDRAELRRAVRDGVLMFATDHAPHPADRKALGFAVSANGIVGLETAIAITYEVMVEEEGMDVESWASAWWNLPRSLFPADLRHSISDLPETRISVGERYSVDLSAFASLSRNCPYADMKFKCRPLPVVG